MANKRLSADEVVEMKEMVRNGTSPEDIAKHFGVAISSVHNYKKKFKADGLSFPSVRGRRPSGSVNPVNNVPAKQSSVVPKSKPIGQINSVTTGDNYRFIVNGVSVKISGEAKNVSIGKDHMEINF